jgi:hypothetical protein
LHCGSGDPMAAAIRVARECRADGRSSFPLFRSNFRATPEELKRISPAATMELRCKICKELHVFVVTECTIDDTD